MIPLITIILFGAILVLVGIIGAGRGLSDKGPWKRDPFNDTWRGHQCDYISESSQKRCVYFLDHNRGGNWPHDSFRTDGKRTKRD